MKDGLPMMARIPILCLCLLVIPFSTGCLFDYVVGDPPACDCPECPQHNGFNGSPEDCPGGQCPDCPGGQCPTGAVCADEPVISGPCLPCGLPSHIPAVVQRPLVVRPSAVRPATQVDPLREVKTGSFACQRCRRSVVGDGWHELRTNEGDSVLLMCRSCWAQSSFAEREACLRNYLARNGLAGSPLGERLRASL